jgi:hypothetical protein
VVTAGDPTRVARAVVQPAAHPAAARLRAA